MYQSTIFLVDDDMNVIYQQNSDIDFFDIYSKLYYFKNTYLFAATLNPVTYQDDDGEARIFSIVIKNNRICFKKSHESFEGLAIININSKFVCVA